MKSHIITMFANGSADELADIPKNAQEQLEFKFMAETQKPEQTEFAFMHTEEGMDK